MRHLHDHKSRFLFGGVLGLALASLTLVACSHSQAVLNLKNRSKTTQGNGANGPVIAGTCLDLGAKETDLGTSNNGGAPGADESDRTSCTEVPPCSPMYTPNPADQEKAQSWLQQMTIDEKVIQITGIIPPPQSTDTGRYRDIQRSLDVDNPVSGLRIRGMQWRDGPHGLNLEAGLNHYGFPDYATSFPTSIGQGASFDVDLLTKVGAAMGDEVVAANNMILLTPCMNILRHPFWGRANETFGEDTFHLGRVATAITLGLQRYVSGCAKHFAANNIENQRWLDNAVMDEQTLHEVYGRHFEMVVHDGGVGCVMASYNMVQTNTMAEPKKATQNAHLLTDMLRNDMGFKGFVVSDWWAMPGYDDLSITSPQDKTTAVEALQAGLSVEVPWAINFKAVRGATEDGSLDVKYVDEAVARVLENKLRFHTADLNDTNIGLTRPTSTYDEATRSIGNNDDHLDLAEKLAEESMVLLKNDNNTLPIPSSAKTVAVIGLQVPYYIKSDNPRNKTFDFVQDAALGDRGSSRVSANPDQTVGPLKGIKAVADQLGITVTSGNTADVATNADFAVVIVGLTPGDQGEEYTGAKDRNTLALPAGHDQLVRDVIAKGKPTAVVIESGSVVTMPWIDQVKAVVMAWFPGQRGGAAMGKLLFGQANFAGRLPVTWYKDESQLPAFSESVPGDTHMDYYLGYRALDQNNQTPLFAFGRGLSYSTFSYDRLHIPCSDVVEQGMIQVEVDVRNTSSIPGDEVTLVFASYPDTTGRRSKKELKGFARFHLDAGQAKRISIPVRVQDLKYWPDSNKANDGWVVEKGTVLIQVGPSSDNLPLHQTFTVK
jgi:beta-glucosidase